MKTAFSKLLAISILTSIVIFSSSCKKYDDGPAFSMRSKKARVAGEWTVAQVLVNDADQTNAFYSFYPGYLIILDKEGKYTERANGYPDEHGKWEFQRNKEEIYSLQDGATVGQTLTLLRLKNREMWVTYMIGPDKYEVHYE